MTWLDLREIHCIEIYVKKLELEQVRPILSDKKPNKLKLHRVIYFRLEQIV